MVEGDDVLRHTAGGRDDDDHHDVGLEEQHLDSPDGRRLERRRGHEREQARDARQHLRRGLERSVDLATNGGEIERERARPHLEPVEHAAGVQPVPALGRQPSGGRVRVREQPERLERGELVPDGRR